MSIVWWTSQADNTGRVRNEISFCPVDSRKVGYLSRRIQILCSEDRIPGAVKIGNRWAIPDDEPKPADARVKSGKYIKRKREE